MLLPLIILAIVNMTGFRPKDNVRELQYSELLTLIGQDGIANVHVKGLELTGRLTESAIPEGEFGERYDVRCRLPSIDGFHRDINALYAQRLGVAIDQVTPKDYTFTLRNR